MTTVQATTETFYYAPPTHAMPNPIDVLPRSSTNATVSFGGETQELKKRAKLKGKGRGSAESSTQTTPEDEVKTAPLSQPSVLPPPGPAHYQARRALWLTPPQEPRFSLISKPEKEAQRQTASDKINELLSCNSLTSEEVWQRGLKTLSRGLLMGNKLRNPLPLPVVIKILYATWQRDGTWPTGSQVPTSSSSDENDNMTTSQPVSPTSPTLTQDPVHHPSIESRMETGDRSQQGQMLQDDMSKDEELEEDLVSENGEGAQNMNMSIVLER